MAKKKKKKQKRPNQVLKLKKDIVIPAGTIFDSAYPETVRYGDNHVETIIGLTKDSSGSLVYYMEPDDPTLKEWFEPANDEGC